MSPEWLSQVAVTLLQFVTDRVRPVVEVSTHVALSAIEHQNCQEGLGWWLGFPGPASLLGEGKPGDPGADRGKCWEWQAVQ